MPLDELPLRGQYLEASQLLFNPLSDEFKETFVELNETLNNCKFYVENEISNMSKENEKNLSIFSININGLHNKQDDLQALLERLKLKFDIIAISETHLNITSEKYTNLDGYKSVFNSRKLRGWGGVAIFVRSNLTFIPRPDLNLFIEGIYESVFAEVLDKGNKYIVGSIYRPPNPNVNEFLQNLGATLEKIKGRRSYIMGDFNLDLLKSHENASSAGLLDEFSSVGFQPLISLPS